LSGRDNKRLVEMEDTNVYASPGAEIFVYEPFLGLSWYVKGLTWEADEVKFMYRT